MLCSGIVGYSSIKIRLGNCCDLPPHILVTTCLTLGALVEASGSTPEEKDLAVVAAGVVFVVSCGRPLSGFVADIVVEFMIAICSLVSSS